MVIPLVRNRLSKHDRARFSHLRSSQPSDSNDSLILNDDIVKEYLELAEAGQTGDFAPLPRELLEVLE